MVSAGLRPRNGVLTSGVVGCLRIHNVQRRRHIVTLTFTSKDDVALVISATVGVDDLGVGGVDDSHRDSLQGAVSDLLSIGERDLLDDRRLVQTCARGRRTSILYKEDLITGRMPISQVRLRSVYAKALLLSYQVTAS